MDSGMGDIHQNISNRPAMTAVLKDFKELNIYGDGRPFRKKLFSQDKGQKTMIGAFLDAIKFGKPSPISFDEIYMVTLATFKVIDSAIRRASIKIH